MGDDQDKKVCKYGVDCYRKNAEHLREFYHPGKQSLEDDDEPPPKAPRLDAGSPSNKVHNGSEVDSLPAEPDLDSNTSPAVPLLHPASDKLHLTSGHRSSDPTAAELGSSDPTAAEGSSSPDDLLPLSPCCPRENVKQKFLVQMPDDFYSFLDFCKSINAEHPEEALSPCKLQLAGPFRLLLGLLKPDTRSRQFYLTYCRYYFDPPEFQTVLCGDSDTGYHVGYFRDDPSEDPCLVMANQAEKDNRFTAMGDNLFAAVNFRLSETLRATTPFERVSVSRLQSALQSWAAQHGHTLDVRTAAMRQRQKRVLARTIQGTGLVVPYDKKTEVGYRDLGETHASLRRMLKAVVDSETDEARDRASDVLQELVTNVQFANDEGDPGAGLELGLNVFGYGGEQLHNSARHLLTVAYELLGRDAFADIIQAHLRCRRKGTPKL